MYVCIGVMEGTVIQMWAIGLTMAILLNYALITGADSRSIYNGNQNQNQNQNQIEDRIRAQQEADRIRNLPGQPDRIKFHQFSGYISVNSRDPDRNPNPNNDSSDDNGGGRALFYWLTQAQSRPDSKPLILWLNGGPGCSSIAYGAMEEIGPFRLIPDASGLYLSEHSWNKVANLLFLESPAGVGFSYSNKSSDLTKFGDRQTAEDAHSFLVNWFERFPQYKGRDFYIMGESYAGHYIPQLSRLVYERNVRGVQFPDINLKGLMVGNGVLDSYYDNVGLVEYWWDHALISDTTYNALLSNCDFHQANLSDLCNSLQDDAFNKDMGGIDPYSIYTPVCPATIQSKRLSARRSKGSNPSLRRRAGYDPCLENYAEVYFNRPDVQKALHANVTGIPYNWTACSDVLFENWKDSAFSVIPVYKELISAGLKIWLFSGDVDAVVPITGTRYGVESMNLTKTEDWFSWYVNGQVGGRCQAYKGLSLVTIRNAGHEVPYTQPERGYVLVKAFLASGDDPLLPRNNSNLSKN